MKKTERYISFWYCSIILLLLGILFFLWFLLHHKLILLLLLLGCFGSFSVLYGISNQKLATENSYSVIQAISFYNACTRAGHRGGYSAKENKLLREVALKRDYLKAANDSTLSMCYRLGKSTVESTKNRLLRTFWYIRSGEFIIVR